MSGIGGYYELIKVIANGTDRNMRGYFLHLAKMGSDDKLAFDIAVGNLISGEIVKSGTDEKGDLYTTQNVKVTRKPVQGKIGEDQRTFTYLLDVFRRIKFSDQFDTLTMFSDRNDSMFFKKYRKE